MIDSTNVNLITPSLKTTGDARRLIMESLYAVRVGQMAATQGLAAAALMKTLTENVQMEVNHAKLVVQTRGTANEFGKLMPVGQLNLLGDE